MPQQLLKVTQEMPRRLFNKIVTQEIPRRLLKVVQEMTRRLLDDGWTEISSGTTGRGAAVNTKCKC